MEDCYGACEQQCFYVMFLWLVTPYSDVVEHHRLGGLCCLRLHPEDMNLHYREHLKSRSKCFVFS